MYKIKLFFSTLTVMSSLISHVAHRIFISYEKYSSDLFSAITWWPLIIFSSILFLAGLDVISDVLGASYPSFSPVVGNRSLQAARTKTLPCCRWDAQMASPSTTIFPWAPLPNVLIAPQNSVGMQCRREWRQGRDGRETASSIARNSCINGAKNVS